MGAARSAPTPRSSHCAHEEHLRGGLDRAARFTDHERERLLGIERPEQRLELPRVTVVRKVQTSALSQPERSQRACQRLHDRARTERRAADAEHDHIADAARVLYIKPFGSIDLGKFSDHSRVSRPLHCEFIAFCQAFINIRLQCPGMHNFFAGLPYLAKLNELSLRLKAGLLLEFPFCGIKRAFLLFKSPFGYRPGSLVLPRPEWASGMHEQHLQLPISESEQ